MKSKALILGSLISILFSACQPTSRKTGVIPDTGTIRVIAKKD